MPDDQSEVFSHIDSLEALNQGQSLNEQLASLHKSVQSTHPFIVRIGVASYDEKSGMLKTFISSNFGETPLARYESALEDSNSLVEILNEGKPRVVNNLRIFDEGQQRHTQVIKEAGFSASYTMPMYQNGKFWGFIFFNSDRENCFTEENLTLLDVHGHLVSSLVTHEITTIKTLLAALKTANEMVHLKDPETAGHLERMSRFSRLIAQELVNNGRAEFNDEFIEHLFLFAPMHDIGKIGIPDDILLKPAKLTDDEFQIMKTHSSKGRVIVDDMINNFSLGTFNHIDVLRNIAECHHEALDGSGYPNQLKGDEIPLEARIIAVADIFDALTSDRPYKDQWTNDDAFSMLRKLSNSKLDKACVDALIAQTQDIEQIQREFRE